MLILCVPAAMAAVLTKDYCVIGAGPSGKMFNFIFYLFLYLFATQLLSLIFVIPLKSICFSLCQKWCSNLHHIIVVNMKRLYFPQKVPSFSIPFGKNAVLVGYFGYTTLHNYYCYATLQNCLQVVTSTAF